MIKSLISKGAVVHIPQCILSDEVMNVLVCWREYLPEWSRCSHKYYPQEFNDVLINIIKVFDNIPGFRDLMYSTIKDYAAHYRKKTFFI